MVALRVLVALIVFVTATLMCLFALRSRPVLYRYYESGNPIHEPAFAIFNPFRDQQPERIAQEFLTQLGTDACANLMRDLSDSTEFKQQTCKHESTSSIVSLKLRNRTDEPSKVRLYFAARRKQYPTLESPLWVTVEPNGPTWRVTQYDRYY